MTIPTISVQSVTGSNIAAAANTIYYLDLSGLTGHRSFTLPVAASVNDGDVVGVSISTGDDTYALDLKSGAAGDLINGTDHSSTEWSSLFITGEHVFFRCINGTTGDWAVERDNRSTCKVWYRPAAAITTNTAATWTNMALSNLGLHVGSVYSSGVLTARRAGLWDVVVRGKANTSSAGAKYYRVRVNGLEGGWAQNTTSNVLGGSVIQVAVPLAKGATLTPQFISQDANVGLTSVINDTYFTAREILL
jgi:hypothetical protein